jgi:heme/copper-type cytochrome/quinol oxidase subunit 1
LKNERANTTSFRHIPQLWFVWTAAFFLVLQTFFTFFFDNPTLDIPLNDTYFVFSTSRLLLLLAAQMFFMAMIYWMFEKMNRTLHKNLGIIHFFVTQIALLLFGVGLIQSGFFSSPRLQQRADGALFDYELLKRFNYIAGFLLLFAQIIFVINCLFALFSRQKK